MLSTRCRHMACADGDLLNPAGSRTLGRKLMGDVEMRHMRVQPSSLGDAKAQKLGSSSDFAGLIRTQYGSHDVP